MKTIVLLSGGLDSTLALYSVLAEIREEHGECGHYDPVAINFRYGQVHEREIRAARDVCAQARVKLVEHDLGSCLDVSDVPGAVVPARNLVFLAAAASYAGGEPARIVIGACSEDRLGFPDCRPEFFKATETAFQAAALPVKIATPFLHLTKGEAITETLEAATESGHYASLLLSLGESWSCYDPHDHPGIERPCGVCLACLFRRDGFKEAGLEDPSCW